MSRLEQETTRLRYTTFTALISVSFILPGLAFTSSSTQTIVLLGQRTNAGSIALLLGLFFYIFTVIHYLWYHRYAHRYRSALKVLERELGLEAYRLRRRPTLGPMKFHFDWLLYVLGASYLYATASYVGWLLTLFALGINVLLYLVLLLWSIWWKEEPLESG